MADVQGKLDEIITMVETAKGKALSGSACVIDRSQLLGALEELRQLLPAEMSEARSLLRERDALADSARVQADELLGQARAEADRTVALAREERARLISESALLDEAERVAVEITAEAHAEAARMREQTDDYVDASLARFEQLLAASLETVARGRARVAAARAEAAEAAVEYAESDPAGDGREGDSAGNGYASADGLSWDSDAPPIRGTAASVNAGH
jgi:cell division septum initiation protein DivIVA